MKNVFCYTKHSKMICGYIACGDENEHRKKTRSAKEKESKEEQTTEIRERNRAILMLILAGIAIIVVAVAGYRLLFAPFRAKDSQEAMETAEEDWEGAPPLDVQLLTVNEYSRPGIAMEKINGIVIHYTANPGSSARPTGITLKD